jgi:hypothetical protein
MTTATATTEQQEEKQQQEEETVFSEEREFFYTQIKNNWPAYRKASKTIEIDINKVISSYHEEHLDWSATNIVRHIAADL